MGAVQPNLSPRAAGEPNKLPAEGVSALDRPPLLVTRRGLSLIAASDLDAEMIAKFSPTRPIQMRLTQERHEGQHRLYWSLLTKVAENIEGRVDAEAVHLWVKTNVDSVIVDRVTREVFRCNPASTAFDRLDQPAWHDFFRRVLDAMVTRIIPGMDRPSLTREAAALLGYAA